MDILTSINLQMKLFLLLVTIIGVAIVMSLVLEFLLPKAFDEEA